MCLIEIGCLCGACDHYEGIAGVPYNGQHPAPIIVRYPPLVIVSIENFHTCPHCRGVEDLDEQGYCTRCSNLVQPKK